MHHIIGDAWTMNVVLMEVMRIYAGENLPKPTLHYADYSVCATRGRRIEWRVDRYVPVINILSHYYRHGKRSKSTIPNLNPS
jgi:Condensation domain